MSFHSIVQRKVSVKGIVRLVDPLVIGSRESEIMFADIMPYMIPIDGVDTPCIPGSSLKGVIRSEVEYILKEAAQQNSKLNCCNITNYRESCGGKNGRKIQQVQRNRREKELEKILDGFCLACQMFGSPGYRSRITIFDSFPTNHYTNFSLGKLNSIAINRLTGENVHGSLYSIQYINPESEFTFELKGVNLTTQQIALLFTALDRIYWGYRTIGGFGTKGFGRVKILLKEVDFGRKKIKNDFTELPKYEKNYSEGTEIGKYTKSLLKSFKKIWSEYVVRGGSKYEY